ncbi:MAG: PilZ domain-containing protein [Desulfobacterales bacterium]
MLETGKREMERFSLELPAKISVVGEKEEASPIEATTTDICAGGAFFHTDRPLPVGTKMHFDLVLSLEDLKKLEGKRASIQIKGAVVRVSEEGMAISFDENYEISPLD